MKTSGQPSHQTGFGRGQIYARHPDLRKSEPTRPLLDLRHELMVMDSHLPIVKTTRWQSPAQTQAFAQQWAAALQRQSELANVLVTLHGDLGAGKTTLVRYLLQALGVQGRIKSPTYALVESYTLDRPALSIWHFDFYRFNDPNEWEEAGLREMVASSGLKLVEWPEKAGGRLPQPDLALHLELQADESRAVTLTAHTVQGAALLQEMQPW